MIMRVLKWRAIVYTAAWWITCHMTFQAPLSYIIDAIVFLAFLWCFYEECKG